VKPPEGSNIPEVVEEDGNRGWLSAIKSSFCRAACNRSKCRFSLFTPRQPSPAYCVSAGFAHGAAVSCSFSGCKAARINKVLTMARNGFWVFGFWVIADASLGGSSRASLRRPDWCKVDFYGGAVPQKGEDPCYGDRLKPELQAGGQAEA
jgi:hypothetical protein